LRGIEESASITARNLIVEIEKAARSGGFFDATVFYEVNGRANDSNERFTRHSLHRQD
jgi:hypothetical protein